MLNPRTSRPRYALLAAALSTALWPSGTSAHERVPVTDLRPLLATALDRGEAHGVLVGEAARWIAQHFGTRAPIEVDVKTVKALARTGCMRLAITTAQDGVVDFNREGRAPAPRRQAFTWTVNYCRDGSLPGREHE
jgi:hypothetical protein